MPRRQGGETRRGAIWRSAHPDRLDADDWRRLRDAGITTVVDLRNDDEREAAAREVPGIRIITAPLEDVADPEYAARWNGDWATPDFYAWGRGHWPRLWSAVLTAIAEAPGGVLLHCAGGRDRTGMISALLLETARVDRTAILDDYERGIREAEGRDIDDRVGEYRRALDELLDRLRPEPELRRAAARLI